MNSRGREMNFEKALTELEQIVNKLEKGGLSLNESLALKPQEFEPEDLEADFNLEESEEETEGEESEEEDQK